MGGRVRRSAPQRQENHERRRGGLTGASAPAEVQPFENRGRRGKTRKRRPLLLLRYSACSAVSRNRKAPLRGLSAITIKRRGLARATRAAFLEGRHGSGAARHLV